jgi:HlyD family secretion protein
MKRIRNLVILLVALAVVVGFALVASRRNRSSDLAVTTLKIAPTAFTVKLPENGVVMHPRTATIPALIGGNIGQIYVKAGQSVTAGELLATIEDPTLEYTAAGSRADYVSAAANIDTARVQERNAKVSYQAQADTAKSNLDMAQETFDADATLYKNQAIPRQQLDQDHAKLDQARVAYDQALQQLRLGAVTSYTGDSVQYALAAAKKAGIVDAQNQQQLSFTHVKAPFDGVIQTVATQPADALRSLQAGDPVTAGQALFTIAGGERYIVKAEVDEQDVINVKLGQRANVSGQDFPDKTIRGYVADIAPVATKSTDASSTAKQVLTTIALADSPSFLKDGMTADVDILTTDIPHAVVVPNDAVRGSGKNSFVYVVENGVARKRPIVVGRVGDTTTWVKNGLHFGDVVVAAHVAGLTDGTRVKPIAPSPSPSPAST